MKAVVYKEPFKVAVEDISKPKIQHPNDAIVRVTTTAICGSDLHMYEGRTVAKPGIVFGHENLGIVEEVGSGVSNIKVGERVVMPFNIGCGHCSNCDEGNTGCCIKVLMIYFIYIILFYSQNFINFTGYICLIYSTAFFYN